MNMIDAIGGPSAAEWAERWPLYALYGAVVFCLYMAVSEGIRRWRHPLTPEEREELDEDMRTW